MFKKKRDKIAIGSLLQRSKKTCSILYFSTISVSRCQLKGADRKHKQDREKIMKKSSIERENYQTSYECTVLADVRPFFYHIYSLFISLFLWHSNCTSLLMGLLAVKHLSSSYCSADVSECRRSIVTLPDQFGDQFSSTHRFWVRILFFCIR